MFDIREFLKVGLPIAIALLPIVMAIVTFLGKFGVEGKWQLVSSMLTGLILGGFVMYLQTVPADLAGWFAVVLFGILLGLIASGCYDVLKEANSSE